MPLFELGISSKARREASSEPVLHDSLRLGVRRKLVSSNGSPSPRKRGASAFPSPDKPRICSQRRREIMTLEPSAVLGATCSVRRFRRGWRSFGGGFALELHFLRGAFFAAGTVVGDRQLIMTGGIFGNDLHVFLERGHGVGEFLRGGQRHAEREVRFRESGINFRGR